MENLYKELQSATFEPYFDDIYLDYGQVYTIMNSLSPNELKERLFEFTNLVDSDPDFNYSIQEFQDWLKNEVLN